MSAHVLAGALSDMDGELAHLVKEELQRGWHVQKVLSAMELQRMKEASDRLEHCTVDGLGQHVMDIPADAYFAWKAKLGNDCWSDHGFRDWFKKNNPETVIKYTPRKTTVSVA